jgi:hypothetical protein
MSPLIAN